MPSSSVLPTTPGEAGCTTSRPPSNFNSINTKQVDLDIPQNYSGLTIVTFKDTANPSSGLGGSFADVPNLFGDGVDDIAIGEPGANLLGRTNNGGVFIYQVPTLPSTLGANNVVQVSTASAAFTIAGPANNAGAGFSVANAGNVDGSTGPLTTPINDILIGAPSAGSNAGAAYLLYGGTSLTSAATGTVVDINRITEVIQNPVQSPPPPVGAIFLGGGTDQAGYAVGSAGDFNGDGLGDFMIGSPGANGQAGRVNLVYGAATLATGIRPISANTTNNYATFALASMPTNQGFSSVLFGGGSSGDRAGYSLSAVGTIGTGTNPIVIGAPGWNGGQGSVYELIGTSGKTFTTTTVLSSSVARQYTLLFPTTFSSSDAIGFGSGVSAYYAQAGGDFVAGAPGYTGTLPTSTSTPPTPLVGASAVVLQALQPDNTLPQLGGSSGGGGGGGGGGSQGGLVVSPLPPGLFIPSSFIPPFGSSFVPTTAALSTLNYAPIPLNVALNQYMPPDGFRQRINVWHHPKSKVNPPLGGRTVHSSGNLNKPFGVWTLGSKVFTRGRFHAGSTNAWTHPDLHGHKQGRVVPVQLSRQRYTDKGSSLGRV